MGGRSHRRGGGEGAPTEGVARAGREELELRREWGAKVGGEQREGGAGIGMVDDNGQSQSVGGSSNGGSGREMLELTRESGGMVSGGGRDWRGLVKRGGTESTCFGVGEGRESGGAAAVG